MVNLPITYQQIKVLIEGLDPDHRQYLYQIKKLEAVVYLVSGLSATEKIDLRVRLYCLEHAIGLELPAAPIRRPSHCEENEP